MWGTSRSPCLMPLPVLRPQSLADYLGPDPAAGLRARKPSESPGLGCSVGRLGRAPRFQALLAQPGRHGSRCQCSDASPPEPPQGQAGSSGLQPADWPWPTELSGGRPRPQTGCAPQEEEEEEVCPGSGKEPPWRSRGRAPRGVWREGGIHGPKPRDQRATETKRGVSSLPKILPVLPKGSGVGGLFPLGAKPCQS